MSKKSSSLWIRGGGGPKVMCPALSTATRSLTPADCRKKLPFICEYSTSKKTQPTKKPEKIKPKLSSKRPKVKPPPEQTKRQHKKKPQLYERPDKIKKDQLKAKYIQDKKRTEERRHFANQVKGNKRKVRDEMK